jgi:DNA-binding MarR family transcriptional regulator
MNATAAHLMAFSSLLARDTETRQLHMRHLQVLATVCAHPAPLSIAALATILEVSPSAMSRAVDRLVDRHLLNRTESAEDRRVAVVSPTEAGRALDTRVMQHYAGTAPAPVPVTS